MIGNLISFTFCSIDEFPTEILGFGSNSFHQLGDDDKSIVSPTILFKSVRNIVSIACGVNYTMMLTKEGHVYGVGRNMHHQLGIGDSQMYREPQMVESLKDRNIISIACGDEHTICVCSEGKAYAFGRNDYYQLGNIKYSSQQVHVISSLDAYNIKKAYCGSTFTIVRTVHDVLVGLGDNNYGQIGYSELTQQRFPRVIHGLEGLNIASVSCGTAHTMVLTENGLIYAFGSNESGQLGCNVEKFTFKPTQVQFFNNIPVSKVECGSYFTMVISENGSVYAFGQNNNGQLGTGNTTSLPVPTMVDFDADIVEVGCGFNYAILISDEGKVYRTGQGAMNQSNSSKPTEMTDFKGFNVNTIRSGLNHCIAYYDKNGPQIIPPTSLLKDIERIFDDKNFSDISFVVEGKPIYVNKFLLSLRCEKFRRQFNSTLIDSTASEIIVNNVAYRHYYSFLKYLYTDKIDFDARECVDILNLATEHDVPRLVAICQRMLKREIDIENASYLYQVACLYQTDSLKRFCLHFILKPENFLQVVKTEAFKDLDKDTILEILEALSNYNRPLSK